jgi:uncharacterized membrane protein YqiK
LQASVAEQEAAIEHWKAEATAARKLAEEAAAAAEETAVLADEVLRLEAMLQEKDEALDVSCKFLNADSAQQQTTALCSALMLQLLW